MDHRATTTKENESKRQEGFDFLNELYVFLLVCVVFNIVVVKSMSPNIADLQSTKN